VAVRWGESRPFADVAAEFGVDIQSLGFTAVPVPEDVERQRVHVFRVATNRAPDIAQFEDQARASPLVLDAGAVVRLSDASVSFLTLEICVKLRPNAVLPQVVANEHLTVVRSLPY